MSKRLTIHFSRKLCPKCKDRYPLLYFERGRLEVDDGSVKWISCDNEVVCIPVATICALAVGPGCSVTTEAMKVIASANTSVLWVSGDCVSVISTSLSPTHDSRNMLKQVCMSSDEGLRVNIAKKLYSYRFTDDLSQMTFKQCVGIEGARVRSFYQEMSRKYKVSWRGRKYIVGQIDMSDKVNRYITVFNSYLYGIINSMIIARGFSPYLGFIHHGSPYAFTYDIADLYKCDLCIEPAFALSANDNDRPMLSHREQVDTFISRVVEYELLQKVDLVLGELFDGVTDS